MGRAKFKFQQGPMSNRKFHYFILAVSMPWWRLGGMMAWNGKIPEKPSAALLPYAVWRGNFHAFCVIFTQSAPKTVGNYLRRMVRGKWRNS
jgi:hypothetical protein